MRLHTRRLDRDRRHRVNLAAPGVVAAIEWVLPAAALAVIPKCPACVAGYVLLFTGMGLTLPAAAAVRWTLIALCVGALLLLAARAAHRRFYVRS